MQSVGPSAQLSEEMGHAYPYLLLARASYRCLWRVYATANAGPDIRTTCTTRIAANNNRRGTNHYDHGTAATDTRIDLSRAGRIDLRAGAVPYPRDRAYACSGRRPQRARAASGCVLW